MFAPPWETKTSLTVDPVVTEALENSANHPWDPPLPNVSKDIASAQKRRSKETHESIAIDRVKAQAFAKQLIIDFDPVNALLRAGFISGEEAAKRTAASLYKTANRWARDPFVLQAVQAFVSRIEDDKIVSRERILWGLYQEANYFGPGSSASARVAAWAKLAKLKGMEEPQPDPLAAKEAKGGLLLIPYSSSIEEWETAAMGAQAKLKADVRV